MIEIRTTVDIQNIPGIPFTPCIQFIQGAYEFAGIPSLMPSVKSVALMIASPFSIFQPIDASSAFLLAATILSIISSVCAVPTNAVSNCDGAM